VERAATFFELEYPNGPHGRRTKISVTPAPAGQDGAVVMQVDSYGATFPASSLAAAEPVVATAVSPEVLTGRERDVLRLMARGLENQAIADDLAIGYSTVRAHVRSLMAKLGARSRLEAVVRAVQRDLVRVPESRGG
jgi:DNA-binding NarL/FixJ family response regulator